MAGAAPSATRGAAASHGTSDAFVIQMHFMSCLKGVFEMLMAFHQQWWMDILPIMDKLASATYPLHTSTVLSFAKDPLGTHFMTPTYLFSSYFLCPLI